MTPEYELLEELGHGGMGRVHRARHIPSERIVALKFLHPHLDGDAEAQRRFEREIRTSLKLAHPGIIKVLDAGRSQGRAWYAMEYLEGAASVSDMVAEDGPLAVDLALEVTRAVLDALAYCHAQGVVHRDIKSSNVMIGPADRVTLMDFGLVSVSDATHLPRPGGFIGTLSFWAPEVVSGDPMTAAADLWATGVMLYHMVAGATPFRGPFMQAVLTAIVESEPEPLSQARADHYQGGRVYALAPGHRGRQELPRWTITRAGGCTRWRRGIAAARRSQLR